MILKKVISLLFSLGVLCLSNSLMADDNQNYSPSGSATWTKTSNSHYKNSGAYFIYFRYSEYEQDTNTYNFEVGRPSGWYFIPSKTKFTSGEKLFEPTDIASGIKKINEADKDPVSFSMSMNGQLIAGGEGSGTVTWDADVEDKFFWLSPHQEVVKEGTSVTITANGGTTESTWTIDSNPWKDSSGNNKKGSSITLNTALWNDMNWTIPDGVVPPLAGEYAISAATTEESSRHATAWLKVVGLKFLTPSGNPVTAPSASNEFTFNNSSPGVLTLNLSVEFISPSFLDDDEVISATFEVGAIGNSTKTWASANTDGKATIVGNELKATVTFTNLPANNSDFGERTAKITCTGSFGTIVKETKYEVFFPKDGTNHPTCTSCADCPNWFYYWKNGGVCGIPASTVYKNVAKYGISSPSDQTFELGSLAAKTNDGPHTFTKDDNITKITVTGVGKGIKCVAETVTHENNHLTLGITAKTDSNNDGRSDDDEDTIGDVEEANLQGVNTSANDEDTYNMGGDYYSYGDNEVRCRKKELTPVTCYPKKDWANPGCQSLSKFGPTPQY